MKLYFAECPYCYKINVGLYLDETDGNFECDRCGKESKVAQRERFELFNRKMIAEKTV